MASTLQQFFQQSLILWLTLLVATLHVTAALTVQLKYSRPTVKRDSMPDGLDVTLTGETGTSSDVQLRLLQHSVPDVPVYTLEVDESGQYVKRLKELEVNPNVAYYHDLNNDAVMQVTRTAGRGDGEAHYELQGDLNIEGQKYSLNPDKRFQREPSSPSEAESYTLVPQELPRFASRDPIPPPSQDDLHVVEAEAAQTMRPDLGNILAGENAQRRQAARVQPIIIDVVAVADYLAFSRFVSVLGMESLDDMRLYYAFIFSGIDLRYKRIRNPTHPITVRLIKLIICETYATSQFTMQFKIPDLYPDAMDTDKALGAFSDLSQSSDNVLGPNDHAMLFTGYDMAIVDEYENANSGVIGIAYVGTLCTIYGLSFSIIEDFGRLTKVIHIAAHELGHSFSALHDQYGKGCGEDFIMAPSLPFMPDDIYNIWLFSNCSINYFMSHITEMLKTSDGAECLLRKIDASGVTDVSSRLPGQEYSVDQQCIMIYGRDSYMCRGEPASDVCSKLRCLNPSDDLCRTYKAAMGTSCGNQKMCISGRCVYDPRAPSKDDKCVFGDPPGEAFNGQTCSQLMYTHASYCYHAVVKEKCCESCNLLYRDEKGCEYGDILMDCDYNSCPDYSDDSRSKCCETCPIDASSMHTYPRSSVYREEPILPSVPPLVQPAVQPLAQEDDYSQV